MVISLVLRNLPKQKVSVYTAAKQDVYGQGAARTPVMENVIARFVERGVNYFQIVQKGPVVQGKAQAWFNGDVNVKMGDILVLESSKKEYVVVDVAKQRDVIRANKVDHTKLVLE